MDSRSEARLKSQEEKKTGQGQVNRCIEGKQYNKIRIKAGIRNPLRCLFITGQLLCSLSEGVCTPPDTSKSQPTAYCSSQLKQRTCLARLNSRKGLNGRAVKKQYRKDMAVMAGILASGICFMALLNGISKRFGSEFVTGNILEQSLEERYLAQAETPANTVDEPQTATSSVQKAAEQVNRSVQTDPPSAQKSTSRMSQDEPSISETTASLPRPRVALTFDDGPHPIYTQKLLNGLKSRGIRATFFVVGENISGNEDLIRRMADEGHVIGNHTYDHVKLSGIADAKACEEVQKTDEIVRELTGSGTEFVRPPFGSWKKKLECEMEMIPVLWDVDPLDWTTKNTGAVVQRVLDDVEPGDIILLHDFYESSVDAALEIADRLLAQGYEFVTVDEIILL